MFFAIIITTLIALQVLCAFGVIKLFKERPFLKLFLLGFIFKGFILFILAMMFHGSVPVWLGFLLAEAGFDWLLSLPLLFLIVYLVVLLTWFKVLPHKHKHKAFYVGVLMGLLLLVYGRHNYYRINVLEYDMMLSKLNGLSLDAELHPQLEDGDIKIVAVSDLHLGNYITKGNLSRFVDSINAQKPEVLLFVGDIIDRDITPLMEQNMVEEFARLQPPLGKYLIEGNHEGYGDETESEVTAYYREAGFTVLKDSVVLVDSLFYLLGRVDRGKGSARKSIETIMESCFPRINDSIPLLVMDHRPATFTEWRERKKEKYTPLLVISGHTHNGQIFPLTGIVKKIYPHYHGHFLEGDTHFITTSGLGLWGPKFRLGTNSEIVEIDLHYNNIKNRLR